MNKNNNSENKREKRKVTVEAANIEGIASALGVDFANRSTHDTSPRHPEQIHAVLETLQDIYDGVRLATESDSRGRSRKMVRQYADRDDLDSDEVGYFLRVLEVHDLVVQDGNRWRIAEN